MRSVLVVAAIAITVFQATSAERLTPRRRPALQDLVLEAEGAEPEFAADVLIRASAAAGATDPAWERDLLDEAFLRAYAARQAYRRTAAPLPLDTRQQAEALAADTGLDTASLQLRVVRLMRRLDPAHARDLFDWIAVPLAASTCENPLVPAIDDYYATLGALARETFPATALGRADALQFLELYLWRARFPTELTGVANTLERLPRTREEAAFFEAMFRALLVTVESDARGFSTSGLNVVARVTALQRDDVRLGISGSNLTDALRHLLVNQLKSARCRDSSAEESIVDAFNTTVMRTGAVYDGVAPISGADIRPAKVLGALRIDRLWQSDEARRLHEAALDLRGRGQQPIALRLRLTPEWLQRAEAHLTNVNQWAGIGEPAARDYFFEKGVLYIGLLDLVPRGAVRGGVLRSFAEFLRHSDAENRPQLWFAVASRLIELTRSEDSPQLIPILERSGHPTLSLYAHAARVLGSP
jgi:hypothetical protein